MTKPLKDLSTLSHTSDHKEDPSSLEAILSVYQTLRSLLQKYPLRLDRNISKKTFRFLFTCPEDFCRVRSTHHICRIIGTFSLFEKELLNRAKEAPKVRHLFLRILKTPFYDKEDNKRALGLIIATNLIDEEEFFQHSHILKAVESILPGIKEVSHSFYYYRDFQNSSLFLYLEIKKTRGMFSSDEIRKLQSHLVRELKESIERLSPSLFIPRNDEEVYRNIIQMSRELKSIHTLPQVMISFQEQKREALCFTTILLRVKKDASTLQQMSAYLPNSIRFRLEQVSQVGFVRKKYPKEANVFSLEVESSFFLRKNYSVDLRRARQYLSKALKLMVGNFRDYNGGFLIKQNEQLELIKNSMGEEGKKHTFLIETLFYSLTPSLMQTLILPHAGKALISLFLDALKKEFSKDNTFLFWKKNASDFAVAVIKTRQTEMKEVVYEEIRKFSTTSYQFGWAAHQIEDFFYICVLHQYPADSTWLSSLDSTLHAIFEDQKQTKRNPSYHSSILKINFQDGDPPSLNPHIGIDLRCRSLQKALFEGLTRINPQGIPELAAAEKVEISSCQKHYLFHLRPMQWSNGEEVTASHFEWAWKKALRSTSPCLRPDLFYAIHNAKKVHLGEAPLEKMGVRAIHSKLLEVQLEYPFPYFFELLAHPIFSPLFGDTEEPIVFNGPFVLQSWIRDHSLSLARNPYYWDAEHVRLNGITISIIRDPEVAYRLYRQGELDCIGDPFSVIPHEAFLRLKEEGTLKSKDATGICWLYCNVHYFPLRSAHIRRALAYAIHRKEICETILIGQTPNRSPLPNHMSLLSEQELYQDGNGGEARRLFKEGLKELKLSAATFPPLLFLHSHIPGQEKFAKAISLQWEKELDIQVQVIGVEWNTLSTMFDNRHFHIGGCFRHFFYRDPLYIFNLFKEPTNAHNASGWEHLYFQELVSQANQTVSPSERQALLRKAETILLEEMPVIPTHQITYHYLTRPNLKGIFLCHSGDVDFKWVYFE